MNWTLHDTYRTHEEAESDGVIIVKVGLSKGVKIKPNKKNKARPFELYIRATEEQANG
jgi:hypothetical protein